MKEILIMIFSNSIEGVNPLRSFVITVLSFVFGITVKDISGIMEIIAFGISIIAGVFTIIHIYFKIKDRNRRVKEEKRLKNK